MEIVTIISLALGLIGTILSEFFSARARSRERNEKFEINKASFLKVANEVITKQQADLKRDSENSRDLDRRMDGEF